MHWYTWEFGTSDSELASWIARAGYSHSADISILSGVSAAAGDAGIL